MPPTPLVAALIQSMFDASENIAAKNIAAKNIAAKAAACEGRDRAPAPTRTSAMQELQIGGATAYMNSCYGTMFRLADR
jgi:hypothetical protein